MDYSSILTTLSSVLIDLKCKVGLHPYPKRWSKRERFKGMYDQVVFLQFKHCPECGAERSREV